jgi:hypothetical protein
VTASTDVLSAKSVTQRMVSEKLAIALGFPHRDPRTTRSSSTHMESVQTRGLIATRRHVLGAVFV